MTTKIHPLWSVCILSRIVLIFIVIQLHKYKVNKFFYVFLFIMGSGFIYKAITGSNNEKQISKVFWHETRIVHGILYLLSFYYIINNNIRVTKIILILDIVFSFIFRFL